MEKSRKIVSSQSDTKASVSYLNLIKSNLRLVLTISLIIFSITLLYAVTSSDIYRSSTILKISEPQSKNILDSPFEAALGSSSTDRYIANEIEVMKNRSIREMVARVIIDSFQNFGSKDDFDIILNKKTGVFSDGAPSVKSDKGLASILTEHVEIEQKDGLDFIEISVESGSPKEVALIANSYAKVYREFNLADSRKQLTKMKEFLASQRDEKLNELILQKII